MNIILGREAAQQASERYVVLELDHFRLPDQDSPIPAYCVIEHIPLEELGVAPALQDMHANLVRAYRQQQWDYCLQTIHGLRGHWRGDLDSFYADLESRIQDLRTQELAQDWDGSILRQDDPDPR